MSYTLTTTPPTHPWNPNPAHDLFRDWALYRRRAETATTPEARRFWEDERRAQAHAIDIAFLGGLDSPRRRDPECRARVDQAMREALELYR